MTIYLVAALLRGGAVFAIAGTRTYDSSTPDEAAYVTHHPLVREGLYNADQFGRRVDRGAVCAPLVDTMPRGLITPRRRWSTVHLLARSAESASPSSTGCLFRSSGVAARFGSLMR